MTVVPKGKPKELSECNQIEGKIGQAKQGYGLNDVKVKLASTSNSWIGLTLFVLMLFTLLNNKVSFSKKIAIYSTF